MTFLAPGWLWLLALVCGLAAAYVVLQRRRKRYAVRFPNLALLSLVAPRFPGWRRHLPATALLLALTALVMGLSRPARAEQVPRDEAVVMLVIDVSGSMTATDVAPTRLEAAVEAAKDFADDLPDEFLLGLVVFDDAAHVLTTPTTDRDAVGGALDSLSRGPGTAAGEGVYAALDAIADSFSDAEEQEEGPGDERPVASMVLLADGASTIGRPVEQAARAARQERVPIATIAFGTDSGTALVGGRRVPVPADPETMERVAEISGGRFFEAATSQELRSVYEDIGSRVGFVTVQREIVLTFMAFAVAACVLAAAAASFWNARFV